jgi:nucleotide-binding universal stress UspA family protein
MRSKIPFNKLGMLLYQEGGCVEGKNRILLAVDGSAQALEAVRYVSNMVPSQRSHVVLYYLGYETTNLYSDLDANPLYRSKIADIKRWMGDERISMGSFMESAEKLLFEAGYDKDSVEMKIENKGLGVSDDIIREAYNPYSAVVVGRTGTSKFKDALMKSAAYHIIAEVKHIPVIVVGGTPRSQKVLIAFDGSIGSMKGVISVAQLLGGSNCQVMLYTLIVPGNKFWIADKESLSFEEITDTKEYNMKKLAPRFTEAKSLLKNGGILSENITNKVVIIDANRAKNIIATAEEGGFQSIVVGRRGQVSALEEFFVSRISEKILKFGEKSAVWII